MMLIRFAPNYRVGHVVLENGCWEWQGAIARNGYGFIRINGHTDYAHRAYYKRARGLIPFGTELDHLCRYRRCVNPDHLETVTRAQNAHRGAKCKVAAADVRAIRRSAANGIMYVTLARLWGLSAHQISEIARHRAWRDVA